MNIYEGMAPQKRFKLALDVQDACNMRAIARAFVAVVDAAATECPSTDKVWADPAVRLFVNKLESLSHSEATFSEAYDECHKRAAD